MKRKLLLTSMLLLLTGLITHAQDLDIKPSQQAQGILESKNGMVDHATGLFHYKVPLYEIKSGNFTLPISLNYVAKGVKADDKAGLVGYNWSLNTGGVITRTVRGGIPDEKPFRGYLYQNFKLNPTATEIKNETEKVNKRIADGESDIFTVQINGQTINFIIKKDGNKIIAIPLEKTNIRIDSYNFMNTWVIIDENSTIYTFSQKELSVTINREEAAGSNSISNESYISSWYLTEVQAVGSYPITYTYKVADTSSNISDDVITLDYYSNIMCRYNYGKTITDYPFDFTNYYEEFQQSIDEAKMKIGRGLITTQLESAELSLMNFMSMTNPFSNIGNLNFNFKIMGILSNYESVSEPSSIIMDQLASFYDIYDNESYYNNPGFDFKNAMNIMATCLEETKQLDTKEMPIASTIRIRTPILDKIECLDETIKFDYTQFKLNEIKKLINNKLISSIKIDKNELPKSIYFCDDTGTKYDEIRFNYYTIKDAQEASENSTSNPSVDLWGYYCSAKERYSDYVDGNYAKINSLKNINLSSKGSIKLDYESNEMVNQYGNIIKSGGIRLKSITIQSDTNKKDIINYRYPESGVSVFAETFNSEIVNYDYSYGNFSDQIIYNKIVNKGIAYVNMGNNGLYYPYVQEDFFDNGMKAYLFFTQKKYYDCESCYYWLNGLPLATVTYNQSGIIKNITKNKYIGELHLIDELPNFPNEKREYFVEDNRIKFSSSLPQIVPFRHYMNAEEVTSTYQNQKSVQIYNYYSSKMGQGSFFIHPYDDVFFPNIKPRLSPVLPEIQHTKLYYGGKILLKEQVEYRFEDSKKGNLDITDFNSVCGTPFKKIEYFYDNLKYSTYPTREVVTNSKGDQIIKLVKRVTELCDTVDDNRFENMKRDNLFSRIVKEQTIHKKAGNHTLKLIEDKVYRYNNDYIGLYPNKIYSYKPTTDINAIMPVENCDSLIDSKLFQYSSSGIYTLEESISYDNNFLPIESKKRDGIINAVNYDPITKNVIFKGKGIYIRNICATDLRPHFIDVDNASVPNEKIPISVPDLVKNKKYKLYVIYSFENFGTTKIDYTIYHSEGTSNCSAELMQNDSWTVNIIDIDLSCYTNAYSITVSCPNPIDVPFILLAPDDCEFEAMSYNHDKTMFCKFNHNGQMETYEYDNSRRVIKVIDNKGNPLKEIEYNKTLNN